MRTLQGLKDLRERTIAANANASESDKKKARKELAVIKDAILYLEHNPSESFVKEQLELVEKKIKRVNEMFDARFPKGCHIAAVRTKWFKDEGMPTLKTQKEMLEFLLKND